MTDCSCDLTAIPAAERAGHVALARSLFFGEHAVARETAEGYEVEIPADRFQDAARFVENERRCCAHLAFSLMLPARGEPLRLRVSGPGATEALRALVV
jgi:hypothetical protein